MNKTIIGAVIVIVVTVVAGGIYWNSNREVDSGTSTSATEQSPTPTSGSNTSDTAQDGNSTRQISKAEVAEHSSEQDCWTIIDGQVYDITQYIPRHPGGDDILAACGADGTSLFNSRTTNDGQSVGSGTPHSSSAQSQLSQFLVGTLGS